MNKRSLGWVLLVLGLLIAALAVFRDAIFVGASAGFGFQQAIGLAAGLAVAIVGWLMARRV